MWFKKQSIIRNWYVVWLQCQHRVICYVQQTDSNPTAGSPTNFFVAESPSPFGRELGYGWIANGMVQEDPQMKQLKQLALNDSGKIGLIVETGEPGGGGGGQSFQKLR